MDSDDQRTQWLMQHEAWLRMLARSEIDSRFQGKFSASDAVQQTLLEAWRVWDNFRGSTEAERAAWLRGILAHQLAHLARHFAGVQKRDVAREQSLNESLARSSQRLDQFLQARSPSPSDECIRAEQRRQLAEMLDRLPHDYRQVILLRNIQELGYEEIARCMNRTPGAVRMLWVRALAQLRDEIQA
jgi:RNA polymerase sigma-70 factor (ECF subfamily)